MQYWSLLFIAAAIFGLIYTALSWALLCIAKRSESDVADTVFAPPITVFKPLKGVDEDLEGNLGRFFRQSYPSYELIFGVNDTDDPAIPIVQKLQAGYPNIRSRLVVDTFKTGYNPKVNNLCNMASHAAYDYWVVSDSNVRVTDDYLVRLVRQVRDPRVGLVTSLIRGVGGRRLGARLENLHLNSFIGASTIAVNRLSRIPVSIGKSMLMRRQVLEQIGGFEAFAGYLLEDGLIGRRVRELGYETRTSVDTVDNVNNSWSVKDFMSRHYRWGLMRRQLNLGHYSGEILSNPIITATVAAALYPSATMLSILGTVIALKVTLDLMIVRNMGGKADLGSALLLPLKDVLIATVWFKPFFTNRVSWRGNHFRIGAMTRITPDHRESFFKGRSIYRFPTKAGLFWRLVRPVAMPERSEA
jgi:ceramide glucosyltransferase